MIFIRFQDIIKAFEERQEQLDTYHDQETMGDVEYAYRSSELKGAINYIQLIIDELELANGMIKPGAKSE